MQISDNAAWRSTFLLFRHEFLSSIGSAKKFFQINYIPSYYLLKWAEFGKKYFKRQSCIDFFDIMNFILRFFFMDGKYYNKLNLLNGSINLS